MKKKTTKVSKAPLKELIKKLGIISYLDLGLITDKYQAEEVFDVELGEKMKGKSPDECEKIFAEEGRRAMTLREVLSCFKSKKELAEYLDNYNFIDCPGSRYDSSTVPSLYLVDGQPELYWCCAGYDFGRWGSASCGISGTSEAGNLETRVEKLEEQMKKITKIINI